MKGGNFMKKITKKENFTTIIEVLKNAGREDLVPVMEHEIELIEKKASSGKKTKTQTENEDIKNLILAELERIGKPVSITELINQSEKINTATGGSNQKVSALMTQLKNAQLVVREQDKKKAVFRLATEEDYTEEEITDTEE